MSLSGDLTPNSFSSYHLTEDEALEGSILTVQQKQVIQNLLVARAEEKLALPFTPNDIHGYAQREASLAGEIAAYQTLIANSELAVESKNNPNVDL